MLNSESVSSLPPARPEAILREAAAHLKKQWPGLSLRAVAARLEISPSYWSKILRGLKPFPQSLLPRVVKVLGLDAPSVARLQRSILFAHERDSLTPVTGLKTSSLTEVSPTADYALLGRNEFWLLEKWHFIPVLNIFTLSDPPADPAEIARRLGISSEAVTETVRRLEAGGFLKRNEVGSLIRTDMRVRFPTDRSFASVRNYHEASIQKAREELKKDVSAADFEKRLITGICFAGSSAKLREARSILEEALYRAANLLADEPVSDQIYQINLQFFPLTKD